MLELSPSASPSLCRRPDAQRTQSASFPCRSHPVFSLLHVEIRSLSASADFGCSSSSASAAAVFERIDRLLATLDDHLRLPQTTAIVLAQHAADARAASRRRDTVQLTSAVRSLRRAEKPQKEIAGRLVSGIKDLARCRPFASGKLEDAAETAEVVGILAEAVAAMAAFVSSVFQAAVVMAVAASMAKEESRSGICGSRQKTEEGEEAALEMLVERLEGMEEGSEKLYRNLIKIRVYQHCLCVNGDMCQDSKRWCL